MPWHDPVDCVDDQPHGAHPGIRHKLRHSGKVRPITQVLLVTHGSRRQPLADPESLPRGGLAVRRVDGLREVERSAGGKACLPRNHRERGNPRKEAVFPIPQAWPLAGEHTMDRPPLIKRQAVNDDQCSFPVRGIFESPSEHSGHVVGHHRRRRRLVMQRAEALEEPRRERRVDPVADAAVPASSIIASGGVPAKQQSVHLRPALRKPQPVLMAGRSVRDRLFDARQQSIDSSLQIGLRIGPDSDDLPGVSPPLGSRMLHRLKHALHEQVVDVDAHVAMAERDLGRSRVAQRCRRSLRGRLMDGGLAGRLAIEEDRPTLLQEREERVSVGDDLVQRPRCEQRVLSQQPEEMIVEDGRNTELPVVPAQ